MLAEPKYIQDPLRNSAVPGTERIDALDWSLGDGRAGLASVIVTAFNQDWVLSRTLESVLAQTYRPVACSGSPNLMLPGKCEVQRFSRQAPCGRLLVRHPRH